VLGLSGSSDHTTFVPLPQRELAHAGPLDPVRLDPVDAHAQLHRYPWKPKTASVPTSGSALACEVQNEASPSPVVIA
jgi:hypothetical protein